MLSFRAVVFIVVLVASFAIVRTISPEERIPLGCHSFPCTFPGCGRYCYDTPVPIPVKLSPLQD